MAESREWDNSFEGINYSLCVYGDEASTDKRYRRMMIETLLRLPETVRRRVLDEVVFIVMGDVIGHHFNMVLREAQTLNLISLNFHAMRRWSQVKIRQTIAHEIAHFILGHGGHGGLDAEKEADDLCELWGFGRVYNSYDQFKRRT